MAIATGELWLQTYPEDSSDGGGVHVPITRDVLDLIGGLFIHVMNHADLHLSFHLLDALVHGGSIVSQGTVSDYVSDYDSDYDSDYVFGLRYDVP